jgi:hypothetical protein
MLTKQIKRNLVQALETLSFLGKVQFTQEDLELAANHDPLIVVLLERRVLVTE